MSGRSLGGGGSVETRLHTHINTIMPTHQRGTQPNTTACTHVLLILIFSERVMPWACVCVGGAHTRMHVCIYMRWASLWVFMQIGNKPLHPFICARASAHARVCSDPLRRTVRWHSQMAHSYGESRDALWSCARVAHVMTYSRRGARSVTLDHWIGPAMPCKWQRL